MVIDPGSGIKQETTKPAPEISKKGNDVMVSFDAVTYDASGDSLIKSDSRTLYCTCETQSDTKSTRKPAAPIALAQGLYWENGGLADKGWGDSSNEDCITCCNNHYDVPSSNLLPIITTSSTRGICIQGAHILSPAGCYGLMVIIRSRQTGI
ncbi:hypothetical protein MBH78_10230 [Oceanimonas sp. NS1]|nr:hypothetical protein [Oceanimonas sp. NS1]